MLTQEEETFKARLTELRDFLLTKLPTGKFKFTHWVGSNWGGKSDLSCGTTACAFGWATTIKTFQDLGLALYRTPAGFITIATSVESAESSDAAEKAGEKIFGLSVQEFNYLFIPRGDFDEYGAFFGEDDSDEYVDDSLLSEELQWQTENFGRFGCPRNATATDVAENITHFISVKYG